MNANPLRLPGQGGTYGVIDLPAPLTIVAPNAAGRFERRLT